MSYYNKELIDTLINIKNRIRKEMTRRSCYYGPMNGYGDSSWDFASNPQENKPIQSDHLKKLKNPLLAVKDYNASKVKANESIPIDGVDEMITLVSKMETEPIYGNSTSCRSACSGLCLGTCFNTCDGCTTGCSNGCSSCSGGCGSGCNAACGGGCSTGCGSGCTNVCGGACNTGCGSGCQGGCNGCAGCTGGCGGGCTGTCTSGCKGSCTGNCGGSW